MYIFTRLISFVLLIASTLPLQTACLFAQDPQPHARTIAAEALPDAPEPQASPASASLPGEKPIAGQSQSENKQESHQAEHPASPVDPSSGSISGTVQDVNGNVVPEATVVLDGQRPEGRRTAVANDNGAFQFEGLKAGVPYRLTITAKDLESWKSQAIILGQGEYFIQQDIKLAVPDQVDSVTVYASREEIATEQVEVETKQRVLGFIPNFYVTYDSKPAPLSTRLKFKLALKADTDVMTFVGVAFMSAIYQAADTPDYGQGWDAYGKRMAAGYADSTTDIFIGGAILPSLLHQDPRYFYQGTGTKKSRALHALLNPYVCMGDNGKKQPNFSSMGGDLASGAISNLYYPESNRGWGLTMEGFLVTTSVRSISALMQEFLLRKLTPSARASIKNNSVPATTAIHPSM
jgi:Carboxypeptidase regulatory-like domain